MNMKCTALHSRDRTGVKERALKTRAITTDSLNGAISGFQVPYYYPYHLLFLIILAFMLYG